MRSIDLTEEHKSKLLEMCKVLFPEYSNYTFWGNGDFVGMYNIDENGEEIVEGNTSIHWYEFCLTHLFEKLMVIPKGYEDINDYISMNSYFIYGHPVDYLYEEFKSMNDE